MKGHHFHNESAQSGSETRVVLEIISIVSGPVLEHCHYSVVQRWKADGTCRSDQMLFK